MELDRAVGYLTDFANFFGQYRKTDEKKHSIESVMDQIFPAMMSNMEKGVLKKDEMILEGNKLKADVLKYVKTPNAENWSVPLCQ